MPVTVTHAKSNSIGDFTGTVTVYNSSGGSQSQLATNLVRPSDWNSAHQVTLNLTGSEVASLFNFGSGLTSTTGAGGVTVGQPLQDMFEPFSLLNTNSTMVAPGAGTWYFEPLYLPFGLTSGHLRQLLTYNSANFSYGVVGTTSAGQATKTASFRNCMALYNLGTGANSTRIESIWSGECAISATQSISFGSGTATSIVLCTNAITYGFNSQIDISGNVTTTTVGASGTVSAGASTMASTAPNSLITSGAVQDWFTGSVMHIVPFATTLPAGQYWLAHMHTITSGGSTTGVNYLAGTAFNSSPGRMMILDPVLTAFKRLGSSTAASSITAVVPFKGQHTLTSSLPFAFVNTSDMRATTGRLYFNHVMFSSN